MAEDRFEKLGPMLAAIGEQAAAELGGNPDGIYIYAEVGDRWYSVNLFRKKASSFAIMMPVPSWAAWCGNSGKPKTPTSAGASWNMRFVAINLTRISSFPMRWTSKTSKRTDARRR